MARKDMADLAEIMLGYVENNETFQTDEIMEVPTTVYTDVSQFENELNLVFKKVPLMLAFTCEIPNPGDYKAMEVVEMPVLITRGKDGKVRAFFNVCSHRGAPVAEAGHGNCNRFTCIYHGWTYGQDGKLIGIADPAKFGKADKDSLGLKELPCEERAGMIFVSLDPEVTLDLDDYYRDMLVDFEEHDYANWTFLGTREIIGANWKIAFDGYLEGYHFSQLHPETIAPRTPSNTTYYEGFGANMRIGFPQRAIAEKLRNVPREKWGEMEGEGYDFVRIFFPNVSTFIAPELTQVAMLFPGPTPDKNRTVLNYLRKEPIKDDADRKAAEEMIDFLRNVTYEEDYLMGFDIQKGLETGFPEKLTFGKNERGNQFFHEWLSWYLANDPTQPKPVM